MAPLLHVTGHSSGGGSEAALGVRLKCEEKNGVVSSALPQPTDHLTPNMCHVPLCAIVYAELEYTLVYLEDDGEEPWHIAAGELQVMLDARGDVNGSALVLSGLVPGGRHLLTAHLVGESGLVGENANLTLTASGTSCSLNDGIFFERQSLLVNTVNSEQ